MHYKPVTAFMRPLDETRLAHYQAADQDLPPQGVNKWEAMRELAKARVEYGLSDRDVAVLQALVSFHPATVLGGNDRDLVVHPSNKSICERLNGMACSTMRRHLAHLVDTGFIIRRDSPNGKRYVRRYGDQKAVFGFDLSPIVLRYPEACEAAERVRAREERHKRLKDTASLMRRDLVGLALYGAETRPDLALWDQLSDMAVLAGRSLRRKLTIDELETLQSELERGLNAARNVLECCNAKEMNTSDIKNEHHHQNSNKNSYDSERCLEKPTENLNREPIDVPDKLPNIPLGLVLATCHEFRNFTTEDIRHWHDLVNTADRLCPMMGISPSAWDEAKTNMGPEEAAVVVVAMLERFAEIKSPGGYLRSLSTKAGQGVFSCGPMIMALMRKVAA